MLRYAPVDVENISASSSGHATRDSVKHSIEAPALFNHVMAGSCSRAASTCLTYPLDTLKTRLQCCSTSSSFIGKDLLLGISGSLPGTMASAAVYFLVDNLTRRYLSSPDSILGKRDPSDPIFHCTSASLATLASAFLRVPSDVLKHRVQARVYPSFSSAATGIIRSKGPMGCYAGFSATLLRDIPETAIQFALFAKLKQHFCSDSNCTSSSKESLPCQMMLLGGAAGVASSFVCTPLDVIKTKLQCGSSRSIIGAVGDAVGGGRGIQGLFAGAGPRVMQAGAASAIFFTLFEASKSHLEKSQAMRGTEYGSSPRRVLRMPQPSHLPQMTLFPAAYWSGSPLRFQPHYRHHHQLKSSVHAHWGNEDLFDDDELDWVSVSGNSDSCASTLSSSSIWDFSGPLEL